MTAFAALVGIFAASLAFRTFHEALLTRLGLDPRGRGAFAIVFTVMCAMWASWSNLCVLDPWPVRLPGIVRWAGLAANTSGWILFLGAVVQLRAFDNTTRLVTNGFFGIVRHPMYTGFLLWLVGWPLWNGTPASLAVGLAASVVVLRWRSVEEDRMEATYGEAWRAYKAATPF